MLSRLPLIFNGNSSMFAAFENEKYPAFLAGIEIIG
jgi:hypothetical protein